MIVKPQKIYLNANAFERHEVESASKYRELTDDIVYVRADLVEALLKQAKGTLEACNTFLRDYDNSVLVVRLIRETLKKLELV